MKVVFTGPTCYLGKYHFTSLKVYDVFKVNPNGTKVIKSDNDYFYVSGHLDSFPTLEEWRETQLNRILVK